MESQRKRPLPVPAGSRTPERAAQCSCGSGHVDSHHADDGLRVRLRLLDGFELRSGDAVAAFPMVTKRLIAFLALHTQPLERAYVAGTLWFEATQGHAFACLRSALWRARRCPTPVVEATSSQLWLAPHVSVDVREQVALARRLLDSRAPIEEADVHGLLAGELLPDWYDDWVEVERDRLRQLRLHAIEATAERFISEARVGEAVELAMAALRTEPLRDSAHRLLIRAHITEGNLAEAIAHYQRYRDQLRRRFGLEPSPQAAELVRGLWNQRRWTEFGRGATKAGSIAR